MEREAVVFKHALLSRDFFRSVSFLRAPMFKTSIIRKTWEELRAIYETSPQVDFISLAQKSGIEYTAIYDFTEFPGVQQHAVIYAREIYKRYSLSGLQAKVSNIINKEKISLDDLERAQDAIRDFLYSVNTKEPRVLRDVGKDAIEYIENKQKVGIEFPYFSEELTRITGGLLRSEITTLAALPGHGKSTLATILAKEWALAGANVALFSLEMKDTALLLRLLSGLTKIPYERIFTGKISKEEKLYLKAAAEELAYQAKGLKIIDNLFSIDEIESYVYQNEPDIVIIDWIQLIDVNPLIKKTYAIEDILKTIKQFSKRLNIATLIVAQHKRDFESRMRERLIKYPQNIVLPLDSDISDSSAIEKISAVIMHLFDREKILRTGCPQEVKGILDIIVTKSRYGHPGAIKVRKQPNLTYKEIFE